MDYQKIRETKIQISDLSLRLQILEELQKETLGKINETQKNCNHDLIFINSKSANKAHEYLQCGKCLVCGKGMTLTPGNVDLDTNELILDEQIIDVSTQVDTWSFECDCSERRRELETAQIVFNNLTNDADYLYSKDCIETEIIEAVKALKGKTKKK